MRKVQVYFFALFLFIPDHLLFSSSLKNDGNRLKLKEKEERVPAFYTLREDDTFMGVYERGRAKYQELSQLIQGSSQACDDGERIFLEYEDLTYVLHKKQKVIESLGFGYRILIYSFGEIKNL